MPAINYRLRSIILWITYLIGITIKVVTEFLPLFLGKSVVIKNPGTATVAGASMNTILFYSVPILLIILLATVTKSWIRLVNLVMGALLVMLSVYVVYSHSMEVDAQEPNYSPVVILSLMLVLSIANFIGAWRWFKERRTVSV